MAAELHTRAALLIVNQRQPPFLKGLAKPEIELVLAAAVKRKCCPRAIVYREGEAADQFFMLLSGRARYFTLTEDGRRVILRWILPNEVLGVMALRHEPGRYRVSAESVRDSELLVWRRADIRRLVVRYPRLLDNVATTASEYFDWYLTAHLALISHSARQRLARVLSHLSNDIGRPVPDGIGLDITNEELADAAHISPFSTSRLLGEWQRKGILTKRRGILVLVSSERLFGYSPQRRA
jgi:CRP/FNR family transcriptional regulator, nitrogen oxide reductase regulator